jgi:carbonic anhydrase
MCEDAHHNAFSRRHFGRLALGAAGLVAFPLRAAASNVTALGLTCIDYRLVDDAAAFFDKLGLKNDYDEVALAGAALAAVSPKFLSSNKAFWDHVNIAKTLHHVHKIVVLDHRDCGAYKVAFGSKFAAEHDAETAQHKAVMLQMQALLKKRHPDLESEFHLMALDGSAERVV